MHYGVIAFWNPLVIVVLFLTDLGGNSGGVELEYCYRRLESIRVQAIFAVAVCGAW